MLRKFTKNDYNPEDLLQAGLDHLWAAEVLMKAYYEVLDSAGYLFHLGLELMLKAWILQVTGEFPRIHSLKDLITEINKNDQKFHLSEREIQTLAYLSKFEALRYPSKKQPVEIGTEDIEQVNELADAIWRQMPDALVEAYERIPKGKKGGRVIMRRQKNIPRNLEFETGITAKK
jgi:HEPN domain-containing protein